MKQKVKGISIVICCYNSEKRIEKTLEYLSKQKTDNKFAWEIVLVDNNSTDNTVKISKGTWQKSNLDIPLKVVKEPKQGLSFARQKGIEDAKYEYLILVDDDNYLEKNYLRIAFDILEDYPEVVAINGQGKPVFEKSVEVPEWFANFTDSYAIAKRQEKTGYIEKAYTPLNGAGLILRKAAYQELLNRKFEPQLSDRKGKKLSSGGDTEISYALRIIGYELYYSQDLVFYHFLPQSRLTWTYLKKLHFNFGRAEAVLKAYSTHLLGRQHQSFFKSLFSQIRLIVVQSLRVAINQEKDKIIMLRRSLGKFYQSVLYRKSYEKALKNIQRITHRQDGSRKDTVFIINTYGKHSEAWLERQLEVLKKELDCIMSFVSPHTKLWKHSVPFLELRPFFIQPLYVRAFNKLGIYTFDKKQPSPSLIIKKYLKENNNIKNIHFQYAHTATNLKDLLKKLNLKVYVHCHGSDFRVDISKHESPGKLYKGAGFKENFLEMTRLSHVKLIANSEYTKKSLIDIGIHESKIIKKYLGVPTYPDYTKKRQWSNFVKILYIGRLIDSKGPDYVIKAFVLACEQGLKGELIIAGDGPMRVTCELLTRRSKYKDRITFLGFVREYEANQLRASSDIFTAHNCRGVLTKEEETLGVSILEAMSAGLPVVTGKNGGILETVIHNKTGFLIEPSNVKEHAQAFLKLANNPELRKEMGKEGRNRANKHFSLEKEKQIFSDIQKGLYN